jgi:hypothetical protein
VALFVTSKSYQPAPEDRVVVDSELVAAGRVLYVTDPVQFEVMRETAATSPEDPAVL